MSVFTFLVPALLTGSCLSIAFSITTSRRARRLEARYVVCHSQSKLYKKALSQYQQLSGTVLDYNQRRPGLLPPAMVNEFTKVHADAERVIRSDVSVR